MKWFLPNRKLLTPLYLPAESELAPGVFRILGFDFQNMTALQTQEISTSVQAPFLVWAITGVYIDAAPLDAAGFRLQLLQEHQGKILPFFSRHFQHVNTVGTAQLPTLLKKPRLIDAGGSITCEVKSLSLNNGKRVQVALWGVQLTS